MSNCELRLVAHSLVRSCAVFYGQVRILCYGEDFTCCKVQPTSYSIGGPRFYPQE